MTDEELQKIEAKVWEEYGAVGLLSVAEEVQRMRSSIVDHFVHNDPACPNCQGTGAVCENHPDTPWHDGECCGGAGMPCPKKPE